MASQEKSLLAIYDITGIQEYIFATRWMRENAGASLIVTRMLVEVLPGVIQTVTRNQCVTEWASAKKFSLHRNPDLLAEIIYIGGGNAVVAYRSAEVYEAVNRGFAKALVEQSYTLNLATAAIETDFKHYGKDKGNLDKALQKVKAAMLRQRPMGALPVVEQESFYGLPIAWTERGEKLSTLQRLKRQAYNAYDSDKLIYRRELPKGMKFAVQMKDLIAKEGENAFVAVVHIDGNGMGAFVREKVTNLDAYDRDIPEMRTFSQEIAESYQAVFAQLLDVLAQEEEQAARLPIRPLIMDGDDITFVCRGTLGVPLAALFLRILAGKKIKDKPLSACAGIALVHHNFPFDIAYEIAEECCRNAKNKCSDKDKSTGYLDFHLAMGAYVKSLRTLRAREDAKEEAERCLNRPYCVAQKASLHAPDSFDRLHQSLRALLAVDDSGDPLWPQSRLKKLYETYLQGAGATQALREEFASRGYSLAELEGENSEASGQAYRLFDALELLELYDVEVFDSAVKTSEREARQ